MTLCCLMGVMLGYAVVRSPDGDQGRVRGVGCGECSAKQAQGGYSDQLLHIPSFRAVFPGKELFYSRSARINWFFS
jgi:hypothetical protein